MGLSVISPSVCLASLCDTSLCDTSPGAAISAVRSGQCTQLLLHDGGQLSAHGPGILSGDLTPALSLSRATLNYALNLLMLRACAWQDQRRQVGVRREALRLAIGKQVSRVMVAPRT